MLRVCIDREKGIPARKRLLYLLYSKEQIRSVFGIDIDDAAAFEQMRCVVM